jgi:hypothetical protein
MTPSPRTPAPKATSLSINRYSPSAITVNRGVCCKRQIRILARCYAIIIIVVDRYSCRRGRRHRCSPIVIIENKSRLSTRLFINEWMSWKGAQLTNSNTLERMTAISLFISFAMTEILCASMYWKLRVPRVFAKMAKLEDSTGRKSTRTCMHHILLSQLKYKQIDNDHLPKVL